MYNTSHTYTSCTAIRHYAHIISLTLTLSPCCLIYYQNDRERNQISLNFYADELLNLEPRLSDWPGCDVWWSEGRVWAWRGRRTGSRVKICNNVTLTFGGKFYCGRLDFLNPASQSEINFDSFLAIVMSNLIKMLYTVCSVSKVMSVCWYYKETLFSF